MEYIDARIAEYEQQLAQSEEEEEKEALRQKIEERRARYFDPKAIE